MKTLPVIIFEFAASSKTWHWWQKKESNYAAFDLNKTPETKDQTPDDKVDDLQRQIAELNAKKKELLETTSKGRDEVAKARADMRKA